MEDDSMTLGASTSGSEICNQIGPVRHLVMAQSFQYRGEDLLAPFCGEAARWG